MPKIEKQPPGVCDKYCNGCVFYSGSSLTFKVCEYMLMTDHRRPCPAGKGCTVKTKRNGRSFVQVMEAQIEATQARAESRERKKETDKLSQEMIQSKKDGFGVSYGAWKATQPVPEVDKPEIPEGWKVCPECGEKFKPKVPYAVYCCTEHQKLAYQRRNRDKRNAYQAELRAKRKEAKNM